MGSRNRLPPPVLVLSGPTASGKSELLFSICHDLGAEIVSADSMQAYRGMDIGTAKPGPEERKALPHHLIDILDPDQQYTAGDFARRAEGAVADILGRGLLPIVAGGTVFYLRAFIFGAPPSPPSDQGLRDEVRGDLERLGPGALMEELAAADPVSAARIHRNDSYRLSRAIEIQRSSGRALSSFALPKAPRQDYDFLLIALDRPRGELYARIDARVEAMFAKGLSEEVSALRRLGYGPGDPGMRAIGYRELLSAGEGASVIDIMEEIKKNTRRYAKRQLTFLKSLPGFERFGADDTAGIADRIHSWSQARA